MEELFLNEMRERLALHFTPKEAETCALIGILMDFVQLVQGCAKYSDEELDEIRKECVRFLDQWKRD